MTTQSQITEMTAPELVSFFRALALKRHDAMQDLDVTVANDIHDRQTEICQELKSRANDQRTALLPLLEDPNVSVRCDAAGRCMDFAPEKAVPVLEELVGSLRWNESAGASYMLELYRSGKWKPL